MFIRDRMARRAIAWLNAERPPPDDFHDGASHDALMRLVRPADVLLVEGMTRIGRVIKTVGQSTWSHAALCVSAIAGSPEDALAGAPETSPGDPGAAPAVLEVLLGQGVIIKPLAQYRGTRLRLCRPRYLSAPDRAAVVAYALAQLGGPYDLRALWDLARLTLPWPFIPHHLRPALFAHRAGPHTRNACSVLIAEAFAAVGYPVLPPLAPDVGDRAKEGRDRWLVMPKDFDLSPFFDIVKPAAVLARAAPDGTSGRAPAPPSPSGRI